jgi:hypothetical protein
MMIVLNPAERFLGGKVVERIVLDQAHNYLDQHQHKKNLQIVHKYPVDRALIPKSRLH